MARIEKTVFISYRRTDVYTALAVYENLKNQGYDVFFDYRSISSGDFEQIITSNIRARAHFLLILTPTALDRCSELGDWLRREIEFAIDEKRNIIPLFFKGFRFGDPSVTDKLTGKLGNVSRYNGLNVHEDYFDEAMHRLRTQYLSIPLNTILHPVSTEVQRVVKAEQVAADKALEQIEDVKELVRQSDEKTPLKKELPKPLFSQTLKSEATSRLSTLPWRILALVGGGVLVIGFLIWGAAEFLQNRARPTSEPTGISQPSQTSVIEPSLTISPEPEQTDTPLSDASSALGIGSTIVSEKDGMTLVYVPAGEFSMGSEDGRDEERPIHTVYLDAFWIDQTEVTNAQYAKCVQSSSCQSPDPVSSQKHSIYFGNSEYENYPVIFVSSDMAKTYCDWAGRRLPTEAEWEKAARSDDERDYPWGNTFPNSNLANFQDLAGDTTQVGQYPNGISVYGAMDMAGNVSEWVADRYDGNYYSNSPASNPPGPDSGDYHIARGGSWKISDARYISSWIRERYYLGQPRNFIGFRCVISASAVIEPARSVLPTNSATSSATPLLGIGSTMTGKDGMTLVYVPAGEFTMGSDYGGSDERPVHKVVLEAFWIDQTEITNAMYAKCVEGGNCEHGAGTHISQKHSEYYGNSAFDSYPVIYVSWDDANAYCQWAGRRLPTEAEWEKAARGDGALSYPWGSEPPRNNLLNYSNEVGDTTEVGKYPDGASPYGALDMAGNVSEWVADWYDVGYYGRSPSSNPLGPNSGDYHIVRGASWRSEDARSWRREGYNILSAPRNFIGFRCAMDATP